MDFACLQDGLGQVSSQIAAVEKDELLGLLMFSVLLAVPLAPVVLALYQRRVQKLMSLSSESPASSGVSSVPSGQRTKPDAALGSGSSAELLLKASDLRGRALWKALALAVTLFSVGIAVAITVSPDSPGELSRRTVWQWIANAFGYSFLSAASVRRWCCSVWQAPVLPACFGNGLHPSTSRWRVSL